MKNTTLHAHTHTPTGNPPLAWSPGSNVLSCQRQSEHLKMKLFLCPAFTNSNRQQRGGTPCCALCQQNNTMEEIPAVTHYIYEWDDDKKGNTFIFILNLDKINSLDTLDYSLIIK